MEPQQKIGDFLIKLSEEPELLETYYSDPRAVLAESGLTEEQQETILSNDAARIQEALQGEYPDLDLAYLSWKPVHFPWPLPLPWPVAKGPVHRVDY
jgi:hypothetical protein